MDECANDNGGCAQECVNKDGAFDCKCRSGYLLMSDGNNCQDINECLDENGGCEQKCVNLKGSYECQCARGYEVAADKKSCEGMFVGLLS